MRTVAVVRTYLEQRTRGALKAATSDDPALRLVRASPDDVSLFRRLYHDVGGAYHWRDRKLLSDDQIRAHFAADGVELWVLYHEDMAAGFFELQRHADGSVEIVYFGLTSPFFGRGLGKHLLTKAAESAWALEATRVWLHTCTLDSPAALPNYLARGFAPYKTETYETTVSDPSPSA
jgi:GNAT superfamily N-acetyltransferase